MTNQARELSHKDIIQASLGAMASGIILGTLASPLILAGPSVVSLALPLIPVAAIVIAIAIPLASMCIRLDFAGLPYALLAGMLLGCFGAFFGSWFWDCTTDICYLGRCSNHPNPAGSMYGVPFGLMASLAFWVILRQRSPGSFSPPSRLERAPKPFLFLLVWGISCAVSWIGVANEIGFSISWCP